LSELGFVKQDDRWLKPTLRGFIPPTDLSKELTLVGVKQVWQNCENHLDEIETVIWPAKLDHDGICCYLIPIQAQWAEHFFDNDLALQRFPTMGVREELHLGVEAVYYTATAQKMIAPARILWYVSQGPAKLGSMTVKATSRLREVIKGTPKELYRQFKRLGVYEWRHVLEAAGQDLNSELTALRFSHTERFAKFPDRQHITRLGIKGPYMSPRLVASQKFQEIYAFATTPTLP
jgi:hypothetical protein